jgi:DNA-binding LytR/AlgR family response regulator
MGLKIVIIEDEVELAENISEYLIQQGYEVIAIFSNEDEVNSLDPDETIDIFLVDIKLNGNSSGLDIAVTLKEKYPKCKIVYSTALSNKSVLDGISRTVYDGYLLKPFSLKSLESLLYLIAQKHVEDLGGRETEGKRRIIPIKFRRKIILLDQNEILFVKSEGYSINIFTEKDVFKLRELLKDFHCKLDQKKFMRIQKSFLVNLGKIKDINYKNCLIAKEVIPIKRGIYKEIISRIEKL